MALDPGLQVVELGLQRRALSHDRGLQGRRPLNRPPPKEEVHATEALEILEEVELLARELEEELALI